MDKANVGSLKPGSGFRTFDGRYYMVVVSWSSSPDRQPCVQLTENPIIEFFNKEIIVFPCQIRISLESQ